jgi:GAF domain-containing protein
MNATNDLPAELRRVVGVISDRRAQAQAASELICRLGGYRWAGIYDVEAEEIAVIAWSGPQPPTFPRFPRTKGLNGAAVALGQPVIAQDVSADARHLATIEGTRAEMIMPVLLAGRVVGTIDVESAKANAFGERDKRLLSECAEALRQLWTKQSPAA